jgi:hypothetical protein
MHNKKRDKEEEVVRVTTVPRHLINPNGTFKQIWNVVMLFLLMYTFTIMPYVIAFIDVTYDSPWFLVDVVVDCLFFCDIVINLNTALIEGDEEDET